MERMPKRLETKRKWKRWGILHEARKSDDGPSLECWAQRADGLPLLFQHIHEARTHLKAMQARYECDPNNSKALVNLPASRVVRVTLSAELVD